MTIPKNPLYDRKTYLKVVSGSTLYTLHSGNAKNNDLQIQYDVPFADDGNPSIGTVTIYNLDKTTRNYFKKGVHITLSAGYKTDHGVLAEGNVVTVNQATTDFSTSTFSFTFREGKDYSGTDVLKTTAAVNTRVKIKVPEKTNKKKLKTAYKTEKVKKKVNLSFKKGTKAKTIISQVASKAGIHISSIKLKKNVEYKKGYTVSAKPIEAIKSIAQKCGSSLYYRRGDLMIDDLSKANGYVEHLLLTYKSGLIQQPTFEIDDNGKKVWTLVSLLQYKVSTGSVIQVDTDDLKGTFRVRSGEHQNGGSDSTTTMEVYE